MRRFMGMIGALIVLMTLVTGGICAASVNWTQLYQSTQQATGLEEQLINATALVNLGQLGAAFDQIDAIMQEEDYLEFAQDMQAKYTALLEKDTTNILYLNILGLVEWGLANYGQASRYFQQLVAWNRAMLGLGCFWQDFVEAGRTPAGVGGAEGCPRFGQAEPIYPLSTCCRLF